VVIDAEEKNTGDVWRGDFTAKYVEEITKKTGNFKKFNVFIKMILEALRQQGMQVDQKENMNFHKN
jgi:coiled-coil domain-containing protein 61